MISLKPREPATGTIRIPSGNVCEARSLSITLSGTPTQYPVGTEFTNRDVITKSDKIRATPWNFSIESYAVDTQAVEAIEFQTHVPSLAICGPIRQNMTFNGSMFAAVPRIGSIVIPPSVRESVDSIALLKAQAAARQNMASIPVLYKERTQSIKLIGKYSVDILKSAASLQSKSLKQWRRAVKRYKRRPDKLKSVASNISNKHLEFVFGVLPLMGDIEGLVDYAVEKRDPYIRKCYGRHTNTGVEFPANGNRTAEQAFPVGIRTHTEKHEWRYSVRTGFVYKITNDLANNASLLGFNPVYTVYDMIPLSFVTGWFSNLPLWLKSLDPIPGLEFISGYSSKRAEVTITKQCRFRANPQNAQSITGQGKGKGSKISQNRVVHKDDGGLQPLRFMDNTSFFTTAAGVSLAIQRALTKCDKEIAVKPFTVKGKTKIHIPKRRYYANRS